MLELVFENDAWRTAASPPKPSSTITTRRVGNEGSARIPSSPATAPAAAPHDERDADPARRDPRPRRRARLPQQPRPVATATRGPQGVRGGGDVFILDRCHV